MAEHTQNALRDPRASLLVAEPVPEGADPLASGRVTLLGLLTPIDDDERDIARARYLEANPAASYYIDFGDFTFLRLTVDHIRYVGGYGRMSWVDAADYTRRRTRSARRRGGRDHRAHERRPRRRAGAVLPPLRRARPTRRQRSMSAVDRYGFDMVAVSAEHRTSVRLAFPDECTTGDEVRKAMVAMVGGGTVRARADPRGGYPRPTRGSPTAFSTPSPARVRLHRDPRRGRRRGVRRACAPRSATSTPRSTTSTPRPTSPT